MTDTVELRVAGKAIKNFQEYMCDADMWLSAAAFSMKVANPEIKVNSGDKCQLYVNGRLELSGFIDKRTRHTTKKMDALKLDGRDMMGQVVDAFITKPVTTLDTDIKSVAMPLLSQVAAVDLRNVRYEKGVFPDQQNKATKLCAYQIGQRVYESLRSYAEQHGLLLFCLPDGGLCFGNPKRVPSGTVKFKAIFRKDGRGNNVQDGLLIDDISKRYSSIKVRNGLQSFNASTTEIVNLGLVFSDPDYPAIVKKLGIVESNDITDMEMIKARACMEFNKQRHAAWQLQYTVPGHSQNGQNWVINDFCYVDDEINDVHGNYLITGRTLTLSKKAGLQTVVRLGLPGIAL